MQLASEMHCIQGLEHCQDSAFISDFSLCLCFLFIHSNFNSWGRDWLAQFEWGTHPWSNSHGQRKRGDVAHSSHESTVDTKVVSSGKESSIDCAMEGLSPLKGNETCDIQCAIAEWLMYGQFGYYTNSKVTPRAAWDLIQTKNCLSSYGCFPTEDDREGRGQEYWLAACQNMCTH